MKKTDVLPPPKETLKQKIKLKVQRIRRYEKRTKFYRQINVFKINIKKIFKELGKNQVHVEKLPTQGKIDNIWESIWQIEKDYNENSEWLKREEKQEKDQKNKCGKK